VRPTNDTPDYAWHFRLPEREALSPGDGAATEDPVEEMVRRQVAALLRCVVLMRNGEDVQVTGFRFMDGGGVEHTITSSLDAPEVGDGDAGQGRLSADE